MTTQFLLTINENSKKYETFEQANAVLNRALRIAKSNQKKYDGVNVLDYMAIDKMKDNEIAQYDIVYIDGEKI